jgi:hypothetical protein
VAAARHLEALTFTELVARTGDKRDLLATVLQQERALGRVEVEGGRYRLVPGALEPELVTALRKLEPSR